MRTPSVLAVGLFLTCFLGASAESPAPGRQVEQSFTTSDGGQIDYLFYLPNDYTPIGQSVPFLLFLHGSGEREGPLSVVAKWGPPRRLQAGESMPYIVVSPQCPPTSSWAADDQQAHLLDLLAHLQSKYRVDSDRLYLTGLSMGGFGAWRLAADHPDLFAAVAPVCGGGDPTTAAQLTKLPIWAWHGTDDPAVPFARSTAMIDAIKAAGGTRTRFTSLEYIGHFSWQAAYQSKDLYEWFDQQRASQNH